MSIEQIQVFKAYERYHYNGTQQDTAQGPSTRPNDVETTVYFKNGQRKIDYVLIYSKTETRQDNNKMKILTSFINNMKSFGLQIEEESGLILDDLLCIKVHAPKNVLTSYVESHKIDLSKDNPYYKFSQKVRMKFLSTILTRPNENDPIFRRAPDTLSGNRPVELTDAERIMIVDKILSDVEFGSSQSDKGPRKLVEAELLLGAYPLHDSSHHFTQTGPLTDRQLLARYWASLKCFYKQQPLNLIEKYYGPEVAFYFAWIGFYTQMLVPASIMGLICFVIGLVLYIFVQEIIEEEVCEAEYPICPVCPKAQVCDFIPLKHSCTMMKITYIIENPVTVLYSILMTFWGVTFMVLWKRKQAMLKLRWNLHHEDKEIKTRPAFIKASRIQRISSITSKTEYYLSWFQIITGKLLAYAVFLILVLGYCCGILLVMFFRLNVLFYGRRSKNATFKEMLSLIEALSSAVLTFFIIKFFDGIKKCICRKVTDWENPRTESDYQDKYVIKCILLSFSNVFFPIIYLAFFKGHFYTHPGDATQWTISGILQADVCKLSGCLVDLSFHLIVIMVIKNGWRLFDELVNPVLRVYFNRLLHSKRIDFHSTTQWERDFVLIQNEKNFLFEEYISLVLQYGFMTFFVVALPIAPLLALISNVVEIRCDAMKFLLHHRRIVPRKVTSIENWNTVMQVVTILATVSNPLLIAFGSDIIPRILYWRQNQYSMAGYMNSTLSEFAVDDYPDNSFRSATQQNECWYLGKRYPPSHPQKYNLTIDFWHQLAVKAIFFIILENVCLLFSLFLGYIIPAIPRKVQIKMEYEENILKEIKFRQNIK